MSAPTRVLPSLAVLWQEPGAPAAGLAHDRIHPVAQHGCDDCPPVPCACGADSCEFAFEHRRVAAGVEWRVTA